MIMKFGRSIETVYIRLCTKSGENRPLDCAVKLIKVNSAAIELEYKKKDLASELFHAHVHIHFISLPLLLTLTCHKPFARYIILEYAPQKATDKKLVKTNKQKKNEFN